MALCGKGTAESPILLSDSPAKSPVKVLAGRKFRYVRISVTKCENYVWLQV